VPDPRPSAVGGKGRPTPKRREAERRRAPVAAPTNRRDAARQRREQAALRRNGARRGLVSGDERALPARDRGPVRQFVRDWVDGQWSLSEFFLPLLLVFWLPATFAGGSVSSTFSLLLVFLVLVLLAELIVKTYLLRRALDKRFPDGGPGRKGAMTYGGMRLASMRFVRLPKPGVRRGESPR
jgi:Flp pilus assembly protein TadB